MIHTFETAIRAWVEPNGERRKKAGPRGCRTLGIGERVLVFDTETTTDCTQRLLFGFFRLYERDVLQGEGCFTGDAISRVETACIRDFSAAHGIAMYNREQFVDDILYPEMYFRGTTLVGFNLPFDLSRVAKRAGCGQDHNRRKFRLTLSGRMRNPAVFVEPVSGRAAFFGFANKQVLAEWEKPYFRGRFLDLSALCAALTGARYSLRNAARIFKTEHQKSSTDDLGAVTPDSLAYGRHDVLVTSELFQKLREEYLRYPFATMENERTMAEHALPMTRVYSGASVAKATLRMMGFRPPMDADKRGKKTRGYAMASYYGGRAAVNVRRISIPIIVVDFTSQYPTVFIIQQLQAILAAQRLQQRIATREVRELIGRITLDDLYDPAIWPLFNGIALVEPRGDVLPVRHKLKAEDALTIAVTRFTSTHARWYTIADIIAAVLLGGTVPHIIKAIMFSGKGVNPDLRPIEFLGTRLDPATQIMKTIIEERQRSKQAKNDPDARRREQGLKILANSGAYGIYAEVNVSHGLASRKPGEKGPLKPQEGVWYSDIGPMEGPIHDERPGRFFSPLLASLVTGGGRLLLAMAEAEVAKRGGTFAFCDTDSLGIVAGANAPTDVPCLSGADVNEIIERFDRLSPYDRQIVPHLLKREYPKEQNLRCYAVSAKRYVLFTQDAKNRLRIVKASESGMGATLGRSPNETLHKLARRFWTAILIKALRITYRGRRRKRLQELLAFRTPMRRKLPIAQPSVYKARGFTRYNAGLNYDFRIKPFSFMQTIAPPLEQRKKAAIHPIAPFERDERASRRLPWTDYETGESVRLDWDGTAEAGTVPVMSMAEFIEQYALHPESKAAGPDGKPAVPTPAVFWGGCICGTVSRRESVRRSIGWTKRTSSRCSGRRRPSIAYRTTRSWLRLSKPSDRSPPPATPRHWASACDAYKTYSRGAPGHDSCIERASFGTLTGCEMDEALRTN